jgi:hypothetical protein
LETEKERRRGKEERPPHQQTGSYPEKKTLGKEKEKMECENKDAGLGERRNWSARIKTRDWETDAEGSAENSKKRKKPRNTTGKAAPRLPKSKIRKSYGKSKSNKDVRMQPPSGRAQALRM